MTKRGERPSAVWPLAITLYGLRPSYCVAFSHHTIWPSAFTLCGLLPSHCSHRLSKYMTFSTTWPSANTLHGLQLSHCMALGRSFCPIFRQVQTSISLGLWVRGNFKPVRYFDSLRLVILQSIWPNFKPFLSKEIWFGQKLTWVRLKILS